MPVAPTLRRQTVTFGERLKPGGRSGCQRLYLTSGLDNETAHWVWVEPGLVNVPSGHEVDEVSVITDFKGSGHSRDVHELEMN